ncbi:hypothetical protein C8Q74DRAFT_1222061 [Fomes fomentarius]|nr:hypothetical protein C8Q74DRAFT_1222061 [Fomes fomentarius]
MLKRSWNTGRRTMRPIPDEQCQRRLPTVQLPSDPGHMTWSPHRPCVILFLLNAGRIARNAKKKSATLTTSNSDAGQALQAIVRPARVVLEIVTNTFCASPEAQQHTHFHERQATSGTVTTSTHLPAPSPQKCHARAAVARICTKEEESGRAFSWLGIRKIPAIFDRDHGQKTYARRGMTAMRCTHSIVARRARTDNFITRYSFQSSVARPNEDQPALPWWTYADIAPHPHMTKSVGNASPVITTELRMRIRSATAGAVLPKEGSLLPRVRPSAAETSQTTNLLVPRLRDDECTYDEWRVADMDTGSCIHGHEVMHTGTGTGSDQPQASTLLTKKRNRTHSPPVVVSLPLRRTTYVQQPGPNGSRKIAVAMAMSDAASIRWRDRPESAAVGQVGTVRIHAGFISGFIRKRRADTKPRFGWNGDVRSLCRDSHVCPVLPILPEHQFDRPPLVAYRDYTDMGLTASPVLTASKDMPLQRTMMDRPPAMLDWSVARRGGAVRRTHATRRGTIGNVGARVRLRGTMCAGAVAVPPSLDADMEKHAERREPTMCSRRMPLTSMEEKKERVRGSYCKTFTPTFAPRLRTASNTISPFDVRRSLQAGARALSVLEKGIDLQHDERRAAAVTVYP